MLALLLISAGGELQLSVTLKMMFPAATFEPRLMTDWAKLKLPPTLTTNLSFGFAAVNVSVLPLSATSPVTFTTNVPPLAEELLKVWLELRVASVVFAARPARLLETLLIVQTTAAWLPKISLPENAPCGPRLTAPAFGA